MARKPVTTSQLSHEQSQTRRTDSQGRDELRKGDKEKVEVEEELELLV